MDAFVYFFPLHQNIDMQVGLFHHWKETPFILDNAKSSFLSNSSSTAFLFIFFSSTIEVLRSWIQVNYQIQCRASCQNNYDVVTVFFLYRAFKSISFWIWRHSRPIPFTTVNWRNFSSSYQWQQYSIFSETVPLSIDMTQYCVKRLITYWLVFTTKDIWYISDMRQWNSHLEYTIYRWLKDLQVVHGSHTHHLVRYHHTSYGFREVLFTFCDWCFRFSRWNIFQVEMCKDSSWLVKSRYNRPRVQEWSR